MLGASCREVTRSTKPGPQHRTELASARGEHSTSIVQLVLHSGRTARTRKREMANHSDKSTSSDEDRHPEECNENADAVEGSEGEGPKVGIFRGGWYEQEEIYTQDRGNGERRRNPMKKEALTPSSHHKTIFEMWSP